MRKISRIMAFLLCAVLLSATLAGCAGAVKDPIMESGEQEISLAFYELMLSRMKGELAREKHDVSAGSDFWSQTVASTGQTREQYYNALVLDRCRTYLAAAVLFDEEGLSLSEAELAEIDDEIAFYVEYDGKGSEEKLDAILSKYGADTEELRQIYVIEAKYRSLMTRLYGADGSQIADNVKEEYYEQNYYRFKQILVSNFYYEYQKDAFGNVIYFDPETAKPVYDSKNGKVHYDDEGERVVDSFGVVIYFDEQGAVLYDTSKGYPTPTLDENGQAIVYKYTDAEMAQRYSSAVSLMGQLKKGNYSAFEAEMPKWEIYSGADAYYPDGYYLSRVEADGYGQYMLDILESLENMEDGEIKLVESEHGYHIVMKYALDDGKFGDGEYAEWFASFNESLQNKLFLDKCGRIFDNITVNQKNLDKARSIANIGVNYNY